MKQLSVYKPWFIEEPTSPDDILGHARIRQELKPYGVGVATGEQCQNRVIWKQLFQANAIDVAQVDACRLGGVNEVLSVLLMACKFAHNLHITDIKVRRASGATLRRRGFTRVYAAPEHNRLRSHL
jgi:L-alanine-DL-glutamate epimerase-like enolase superfamily enzyme